MTPFLCVISGVPGTGKSTIAETITVETNSALLNWDWLMSAVRVFPSVWDAASADWDTRRDLGYELMARMIESRFRLGQSSVADCVTRQSALDRWQKLAVRYDASVYVVECSLTDPAEHQRRISGRERNIPGWDELVWEDVLASRSKYVPLPEPKLTIDAADSVEHNLALARSYLGLKT